MIVFLRMKKVLYVLVLIGFLCTTRVPIESKTYNPLIVENFDDCISTNGAGAWHGGSSTTED